MNRIHAYLAALLVFASVVAVRADDEIPHGVVAHNGAVGHGHAAASDPLPALPAAADEGKFWETLTPYDVDVHFNEVVNFSQNPGFPPFIPAGPKVPRSGTEWTVDWRDSVLEDLHRLKYEYRTITDGTGTETTEPNVGDGLIISHIIQNNSGIDWAGYSFRLQAADILVNCALGDSPCEGGDDVGSIIAEALDREIRLVEDIGYSSADMDAADVDLEITSGAGGGPEITLLFNNGPLASGEEFELRYTVNHQGFPFGPGGAPAELPDGFFVYQHPLPIPTPGAVALAMIGFGIISCRRRSS